VALYALGDREPDIDPTAYVHPMAVVIGSVTIGPESSVWPSAVLRGDHGDIRIGARTSIQDGTVIHCTPTFPTIIGDDCVIGHLAHLEGCAVVGAGAVVPGRMEVPSGAQALGVPATIKPDSVKPGLISHGRDAYVHNASWYAKALRRLD
jgi:carbonic anhydrase/acetyltransferase-like protein (isoleucine patch superfamily)